ncbi:MAG: AAA family ATPase [Candidatus Hodarchaeales archaeon]|jgi:chromosome segregation ATPase
MVKFYQKHRADITGVLSILAEIPFLRSISLRDFLLYEDETVVFPRGVTIVTGRNGAGKSLLIDGIRLGLGMDPRSVRMDSLGAYVREGCQTAQIEITMSNPIESGDRFISSGDPAFDSFLNQDSITIRRSISKSGKSEFSIKAPGGRWSKLDADKVEMVKSALARIGIDPQDPLAFVPADDFSVFIQENPSDKFRTLIEKLGLQTAEKQYLEAQERIDSKLQDTQKYEKELEVAKITLSQLKDRYDLWKTQERLEERIKNLQAEFGWIPVRQSQEKVQNLNKSIEKLKEEIQEREKDITQTSEDESDAAVNLDQQRAIVTKFTKDLEKSQRQLSEIHTQMKTKQEQIERNKKRTQSIEKELHSIDVEVDKIRNELKKARDMSADSRIRSLDEEKKKIDQELARLEERRKKSKNKAEKYFDTKIQVHLDKHKGLRLKEELLAKDLKNLRKKREKKAKRKKASPWNQDVIEFRRRVKELGFGERVIGPLGAECDIDEKNESWRRAIAIALSDIMMDFVAFDKEAYDAIFELRTSEGYDIPIGYIENGSFQNLPKKLEEWEGTHCYAIERLVAPQRLKAYAAMWGGQAVLTDEVDQSAAQQLATRFKGIDFVSVSGERFSARDGSFRDSKDVKSRTRLLGQPLEDLKSKQDPQVSSLESELRKVREEAAAAKKTYENLNRKDLEYQKLIQEHETLTKEIGAKEKELKAFEKSMERASITPLTERLREKLEGFRQDELSKKGEARALSSQIEELQGNIADLEIDVGPLKKRIRQLELGKAKRQKIIEDAIRYHQKIQEGKTRVVDDLEETRDRLFRETEALKEARGTAEKLEKETKQLYPKAPKKVRSRTVVTELLDELERKLKELKSKDLSSNDEKKFISHENFTKGLSEQLTKRKNELQDLKNELIHWKSRWVEVFADKLQTVQAIFDEILHSVGGKGRIEVIGQDSPEKGEAFVWVSFGEQEERELGRQSSGERQAGLVALIIALQSQSVSPISTVDEFDRGLDAGNKARLVSIIPRMVESASQLLGEDRLVAQQFLIVCPEIEEIPDGVSFLTVVRSGDLSQLAPASA